MTSEGKKKIKIQISERWITVGQVLYELRSLALAEYRGLNHHGSLISKRSDDVQREHRPTSVQESECRLHCDQNACPSNPSTGESKSQQTLNVQLRQVQNVQAVLDVSLCASVCNRVCYLQCTNSGSSPLLLSLMEVVNSRKSAGSSGTPWSGHATYCRCVTARSSPR